MNKLAQSLSIKMSSSSQSSDLSVSEGFLKLEQDLDDELKKVSFSLPVKHVYHPLDYASKPHTVFVNRYCTSHKKVMFLGMNPGPWGMCQTGIPFGDVAFVKDWLKINEDVSKPKPECSAREVDGFGCETKEISGQRMWGLFKIICGTPENFFKRCFIYNYCPIAMMKKGGGNVTPSEIKGDAKQELERLCGETLWKVIQLLQVEIVVGVGRYAEKRARHILKKKKSNPLHTKVEYLVHPSDAVPNNENWVKKAQKRLNELKLIPYLVELTEIQKEFMNTAFKFAHEALASQEVPVGCIFVHNGKIVAKGRNTVNATGNPTRHAELNCIDDVNQICKKKKFDVLTFFSGVEVYVTVEPCSMCAAALYYLKVKCIVYCCKNDNVTKPVIRCIGGFYADKAMSLLEKYKGTNPSSPSSSKTLK